MENGESAAPQVDSAATAVAADEHHTLYRPPGRRRNHASSAKISTIGGLFYYRKHVTIYEYKSEYELMSITQCETAL